MRERVEVAERADPADREGGASEASGELRSPAAASYADAEDAASVSPDPNWTTGPAKWAAVLVLAMATLGVALYAGFWRAPRPTVERAAAGGNVDRRLLLDVNAADAAALEQLPGIGAGIAEAIVRDREANGRFARVEDLDRVPGVGPVTLKKLSEFVRVGD